MTPITLSILAQMYWRAPGIWPIAGLAGAGLLAAVLLLYPAQLGAVPWPWRGLLPVLRLTAVFVLVASMLKPVAMRLATAEERGAVVILVDRSKSMSIVDNARTPAQLVALADALGKLRPNVRSDASTVLAADLERLRAAAASVGSAQDDLDYARVSGRDIQVRQTRLHEVAAHFVSDASALLEKASALPDPQLLTPDLTLLAHPPDVSSRQGWRQTVQQRIEKAKIAIAAYQERSDSVLYNSDEEVNAACEQLAGLSRFSLVEQALLRPGGIVAGARKEAAVIGFALADDIAPLELIHSDTVVASLNTSANGDKSDITACIAHAVSGRPVRAVILISDGRQVGGDNSIVSGLAPAGVPIFTVYAAAEKPPHDVSFESVEVPPSVYPGQRFKVSVKLRHDPFFSGRTVKLQCQIGQGKAEIHTVPLPADKPATDSFDVLLATPAPDHVERIELSFSKVDGEASADNNRVERWVKVVPERIKVLLIAGSPTWDFQYVRTALAHLPEMQVKDIVVDPANPRLSITPKEIQSQDVIILFDVPAAAFDERHWEAVHHMAQVAGGSVILVAGDSHLPGEYLKSPSAAALLPFLTTFKPAWRTWPGQEPAFHFVPAPDAESLDFLKLPADSDKPAGDQETEQRHWEQLRGCFRFLQLPELRNRELKPLVQARLLEEESRLPVLTEMRLGAGRAFFLGINETWRWRYKVGGRDQEHFWQGLVHHASENPYFAHAGPLALDVDQASALPNDKIHIRARITEEIREPPPAYALQVTRGGKQFSEVELGPGGPPGSGRFAATLALPAGDYEVRWSVVNEAHVRHSVTIPLHIGATSEKELADLSGDPDMLRKLADASGGEFLTLEQVGRLPERLAAAGDARSRFAEISLWDSPYLFALVLGCLGAEWALRKRVGLA